MIQKAYQRKGISSTTQAGKDFENTMYTFLADYNLLVDKQKRLRLGLMPKKSIYLILAMIQCL